MSDAEAARRAEWLRTRWPVDAVLDADVLAIDDITYQVDVQNDKIEEQVDQLSNLLTYGLLDTQGKKNAASATRPADRETAADSNESRWESD